jgi:hypothetical protein
MRDPSVDDVAQRLHKGLRGGRRQIHRQATGDVHMGIVRARDRQQVSLAGGLRDAVDQERIVAMSARTRDGVASVVIAVAFEDQPDGSTRS